MGDIYLDLTVANLKDTSRQKDISFLVDTGATRAWIGEEDAKAIGIEKEGAVPVELADGSIKDMPYGCCFFNYEDEMVAGNVIIGPKGCEPLAGTHILQDFRIVIDFEHHSIRRSKAMRAKFCRRKK